MESQQPPFVPFDLASVDWSNALPCYLDNDLLKTKWQKCPLCAAPGKFKLFGQQENGGKGSWYCYGCKKGGDYLKLIQEITEKPYRELFWELENRQYNSGMPLSDRQNIKPVKLDGKKEDPEELKRKLRKAWKESLPITEDTPVWKYLSERIPGLRIEWIGPDVRYHPGMHYMVDSKSKGRFPVMLQRLVAAGDEIARTLQRLFLTKEGKKVAFVDAEGDPAPAKKQMSSPTGPAGGSIRLNTPQFRRPSDARRVAVTEGAETGYAVVAKYENGIEVRSMLDCGNLKNADLDWDRYDEVIIFADRDREQQRRVYKDDGTWELQKYRPGEDKAEALMARLNAMGKRVRIIAAIKEGMDFCDIWKLQYERRVIRLAERATRRAEREQRRLAHRPLRQAA